MACSQADCGSHQSPPHHAIISLYTYVTFADVLDFWPQKNQVVMHSVFETIITIVDYQSCCCLLHFELLTLKMIIEFIRLSKCMQSMRVGDLWFIF